MPQKIYILENLDCANCAAKMEAKFNALPQVQEAVITFTTRQLRLTAQDPDALVPELERIARTVEPEVTIRRETQVHSHGYSGSGCHTHGHECGCGRDHAYHHQHGDGCHCGSSRKANAAHMEKREWLPILMGGMLFLLGWVLGEIPLLLPAVLPVFLAAYLILGWEVLTKAGRNLLKGQVFDENFLMSIATVGAFFIGAYPEAAGVMLFYRVGEYFEHRAVERSRSRIMEAVDLRPEVVTLESGETIPAGEARVGERILVRPGDRIPLDGIVLNGESRVDTAPITGEPVPAAVRSGDPVISGCVNLSGQLTVRVEKILSESMVTRILNSVENAAASKPKIDRFITRFCRIYTPVVVALAAAAAVIPSLLWGDWGYWIYTALSFLVMSCPCALVLSVPLAFFSGIGAGSKRRILFKGGLSIEALARVKAVAMDKTGTLTKGTFTVRQVEGGNRVLRLCACLEQSSNHPIAASIAAAARQQGLVLSKAETVEELPGLGIRGVVEGMRILCGNEKLMERCGVTVNGNGSQPAGTRVWVAVDGEYAGSVWISDTPKADARSAVERLKKRNMVTAMLTGDEQSSAEAVARELGVDTVYARLLPEEKLEKLRALRKKYGPVLFVGDGINDAPVLSGADVGAAMGSGADAAIEAADVVFMTTRAQAIPEAVDIARKTRAVAWQNVVFALAVKGLVMVLGLLGWSSMWAAVFADSGVAMLCVLNSIRMLYKK